MIKKEILIEGTKCELTVIKTYCGTNKRLLEKVEFLIVSLESQKLFSILNGISECEISEILLPWKLFSNSIGENFSGKIVSDFVLNENEIFSKYTIRTCSDINKVNDFLTNLARKWNLIVQLLK